MYVRKPYYPGSVPKTRTSEIGRENTLLKQGLETLQLQAFALQQKNQILKNELDRANEQLERVKTLEAQVRELQAHANAQSGPDDKQVLRLQEELAGLKERNSALAQQLTQLRTMQSQLARVEETARSKDTELRELRSQLSELMRKQNRNPGDNDATKAYRTQVKSLQSQVEQLQSRLLQAEELSSKKTGNELMFIPVNGTDTDSHRHVPYVYEVNESNKSDVSAGDKIFCYVQDDQQKGLGTPGRAGYIKNDGPGNIVYKLYDKSEDTWSFPATVRPGEVHTFDHTDNIHVSTVEITPDSDMTMFRVQFSAGLE